MSDFRILNTLRRHSNNTISAFKVEYGAGANFRHLKRVRLKRNRRVTFTVVDLDVLGVSGKDLRLGYLEVNADEEKFNDFEIRKGDLLEMYIDPLNSNI